MILETLDDKILDELADGQWHPVYKIRRNLISSDAKITKESLLARLDSYVESGHLRVGKNDSYRFNSDRLEAWRAASPTLDRDNIHYYPRYFGGILEDDGWEYAPLKSYDLVHFRSSGSLERKLVMETTGETGGHVRVDEGNLFRVFTQDGAKIYDVIEKLKADKAESGIFGLRLEKDLKRRDLEEFPKGFLEAFCRYYGDFAKILLRSHMSSLVKHLPDPDDQQQQIFIWVLDAVERYDASTSIPFAAYLGSSLNNWVFNLNRKAFGRSVADTELKYSRASIEFKQKFGRTPTADELADYLEIDVENVRRDNLMINTVVNLRNMGTIYHEEGELPIPALARVEDNVEEQVESTLLSAAITSAAMKAKSPDGAVALLGIYYETWGNDSRTKRISSWLKTEKVRRATEIVMGYASTILRSDDSIR